MPLSFPFLLCGQEQKIPLPHRIYPATDKAVVEILKEAGGTDKLDGKVTIEKTAYEAGKGESFKFKVEGASFDFSMDEGKTWKTIKDGKDFVVYGDKDVQTLQVRRSGIKAKNAADSVMASAEVKFLKNLLMLK